MYRPPNQTGTKLDYFIINSEKLVIDRSNRYPHFVMITNDFSANKRTDLLMIQQL